MTEQRLNKRVSSESRRVAVDVDRLRVARAVSPATYAVMRASMETKSLRTWRCGQREADGMLDSRDRFLVIASAAGVASGVIFAAKASDWLVG